MAFAWMIAKAAWSSRRVRYKERCIVLERGQLAVSQRDMARALDRDKAWVERLWKRLRAEAMIDVCSEAGVALITICNYNTYQADCEVGEAVNEAYRKADARQGQGTEQRKGKKEKEKIALPDWMPLEAWEAFKRMRKAMKVPFTIDAERGIIADLDKLRGEGHDPEKLLLKAVKRGWRGVFGDEDTKASKPKLVVPSDPVELRAYHKRNAEFYEKIGRPDDAAESRRKLASIGQLTSDILKRAQA
jgi:hypothetical protein